MEGSIINALFRDPVIKRLTAGKTASTRPNLPSNLVAKVITLKDEAAILRWKGGVITASLNARVSPGETLLLEHKGFREGRLHYRIMARFTAETDSLGKATREAAEPVILGLMPACGKKHEQVPAMLRYLPPKKNKNESAAEKKPLFELFMDTESFGLILIRFYYYQDDRLECRFIVETEGAGHSLQHIADSIIAENADETETRKFESLNWRVGNLGQAAAEALNIEKSSINTRA